MKKRLVLAAAALIGAAVTSHASIISFDTLNLGGTSWRYDYTLLNDSLPTAVDEFTIYFDRALYTNLRDASGPLSWDLLTIQPDPALPDDGLFDGLALGAGLEPGIPLGTFSITFDYLGSDTPGSQQFEFLDAATLTVRDSGNTKRNVAPIPVPEPSSAMLALLAYAALGAAVAIRRRRSRTG